MERYLLKIKSFIRGIVPQKYWPLAIRLKGRFLGYGQKVYSQHGEDLILRALFGPKLNGFYVDIGAHHPYYLSNTHYFYRRGWRGINIDPTPNCMKAFRKIRKRDINLEIGLSDKREELTLHMFHNSCLNTLSSEFAITLQKEHKLLGKKEISTHSLKEILDTHLPKGTQIDLLNLDAEMFDLPILKGNDWDKYRPTLILVEIKGFSLSDPQQSETYRFISEKGYQLVSISMENLFFQKSSLKDPLQ